jgi:hypothetical protein
MFVAFGLHINLRSTRLEPNCRDVLNAFQILLSFLSNSLDFNCLETALWNKVPKMVEI